MNGPGEFDLKRSDIAHTYHYRFLKAAFCNLQSKDHVTTRVRPEKSTLE